MKIVCHCVARVERARLVIYVNFFRVAVYKTKKKSAENNIEEKRDKFFSPVRNGRPEFKSRVVPADGG